MDASNSPRAQALLDLLGKKPHRLTRADSEAMIALDDDPAQPLREEVLWIRRPDGLRVPWSVSGYLLLKQLRSQYEAKTPNYTGLLRRIAQRLGGPRMNQDACPGLPEAGLAWLLAPMSPEHGESKAPEGLLPTTAHGRLQRWEAAVTATEVLFQPGASWVGKPARETLAEWWADTLLLALAESHLTPVAPATVLDWFDRLTVTLGWSQGEVPWSDPRLNLAAIQHHAAHWGTSLAPNDQVRLATLVAVWMVPSIRGPLEDVDGTPIPDQIARIHHHLQHGGQLAPDHPLRQALQRQNDPDLRQLAEQWTASERLGRLHRCPATQPTSARRRRA